MAQGKIPVWVYTAKNGYAWQGLEEHPADRPTISLLDKALAAAGKTAGAWGAVVRRPVASRTWGEWPRSRLCWVLFRFHPDAGRDQRGRSCNYTAAACVPAGAGLTPLDFPKILRSPEMSEVRTEGLDGLRIDLDGGVDYTLREGPWEAVEEPSWEATWTGPVLLGEATAGALSRWCQDSRDSGVDLGDLKAVFREGEDGVVAHVSYAVFPQVAAVQAAAAACGRTRGTGEGGERAELENWRTALAALESLNGALGGLRGLDAALADWRQAFGAAESALEAAERAARTRADAAAAAEREAAWMEGSLSGFRMSADPDWGRTENRRKLEELENELRAGRARNGGGRRWDELALQLENLKRNVTAVEGDFDTVKSWHAAAAQGKGRLPELKEQAQKAVEHARSLVRFGRGLFAVDVLSEMERMSGMAGARGGAGSDTRPVSFAGGRVLLPGGRGGAGRKRRISPAGWCWLGGGAAVLVLSVLWGVARFRAAAEMDGIRQAALESAQAGNHADALAKLETMPGNAWLALRRSSYAPDELLANWKLLSERKNATAMKAAFAARERLSNLEAGNAALKKWVACGEPEWSEYQARRKAADAEWADMQFNDEGVPCHKTGEPWSVEELAGLAKRLGVVAGKWSEAALFLQAAQDKMAVFEAEDEARSALAALEDAGAELKGWCQAGMPEWQAYLELKRKAEQMTGHFEWRGRGKPVLKATQVPLDATEIDALSKRCRQAAKLWRQALDALKAAQAKMKPEMEKAALAEENARNRLEALENGNEALGEWREFGEAEWNVYLIKKADAAALADGLPRGDGRMQRGDAGARDPERLPELYGAATAKWEEAFEALNAAQSRMKEAQAAAADATGGGDKDGDGAEDGAGAGEPVPDGMENALDNADDTEDGR